jgi:hypothetical protein
MCARTLRSPGQASIRGVTDNSIANNPAAQIADEKDASKNACETWNSLLLPNPV